jgi:hypothetical protein
MQEDMPSSTDGAESTPLDILLNAITGSGESYPYSNNAAVLEAEAMQLGRMLDSEAGEHGVSDGNLRRRQ